MSPTVSLCAIEFCLAGLGISKLGLVDICASASNIWLIIGALRLGSLARNIMLVLMDLSPSCGDTGDVGESIGDWISEDSFLVSSLESTGLVFDKPDEVRRCRRGNALKKFLSDNFLGFLFSPESGGR